MNRTFTSSRKNPGPLPATPAGPGPFRMWSVRQIDRTWIVSREGVELAGWSSVTEAFASLRAGPYDQVLVWAEGNQINSTIYSEWQKPEWQAKLLALL